MTPPKLTMPFAVSRSTSTVAPSAFWPIVTSVGYGAGAFDVTTRRVAATQRPTGAVGNDLPRRRAAADWASYGSSTSVSARSVTSAATTFGIGRSACVMSAPSCRSALSTN